MGRLEDLRNFYSILDSLEEALGGMRRLGDCTGRLEWPARGVYFLFEPGERRSDTGNGPRVVRVGTHALTSGSKSSLWQRLAQHRGQSSDGGNHRGSIFRLLIGTAMKQRAEFRAVNSWGVKSNSGAAALHLNLKRSEVREREHYLECAVSRYIRAMPFLWLDVGDLPSPESNRGLLERQSIALLSNFGKETPLDPPSATWLGLSCDRERVQRSGLWNNNHVEEPYNPAFLVKLESLVRRATRTE
jgi:hypothetical protein